MKNHCELLLSCRRRQTLKETPFLPSPVSTSAPTSSLTSLCLCRSITCSPEWLQFWGAVGCFFMGLIYWEETMFGLGWFTASPHAGHPAAPDPAVYAGWSITHEHHLQLQTEEVISDKLIIWQRNRALDVQREAGMCSYPQTKIRTVNWCSGPWSLGPRDGYSEELSAFLVIQHLLRA